MARDYDVRAHAHGFGLSKGQWEIAVSPAYALHIATLARTIDTHDPYVARPAIIPGERIATILQNDHSRANAAAIRNVPALIEAARIWRGALRPDPGTVIVDSETAHTLSRLLLGALDEIKRADQGDYRPAVRGLAVALNGARKET